MKICSIDGCDRPFLAKGYCARHYQQLAEPTANGKAREPTDRFWALVDRGEPGECWEWKANKATRYAIFWRPAHLGGRIGAHRFSYENHHGPIPAGMLVMHTCDNPRCVNPAHLKAGTPKENMADMDAKGRRVASARRGEGHGNQALTEFQVKFIKTCPYSNRFLGRLLNVTTNTIRAVRTGRTWSHVT